ncbi:hypothetical protein P8452_47757 [Trifolium repens]|nr:hypothetical protein P8452_47757 [Trifolium repens]
MPQQLIKKYSVKWWKLDRSSGLCLKCNRILISLCISKAIWLCKNTRFVCPSEPGFTKREKKRSLLKSLKIFYVKKMSQ